MEAAQPPASPPAKRIAVGEVVSETFSIYGQNVGALLGSAIVVFVVVGLLQAGGGIVLVLLATAVRIAGHALYTGFVVKLVQDMRDGRRDQAVGDLFSAAAPAILSLIGFGILFAIGVTIGFVLVIVPGLILLTSGRSVRPRSWSRASARSMPSGAAGASSAAKPGRSSGSCW